MSTLTRLIVAVTLFAAPAARGQDSPEPAPDTAEHAPAAAATEADVLRLREQFERVLTQAGLPNGEARDQTAAEIEALAQRSNVYSKQAPSPRARLEASNLEARGYNALAQDAYRQQKPDEAMTRNTQLRHAAEEAKTIPEPAAATVGDFWLLQADLFELNATMPDVNERQHNAIVRLEAFDAERRKAGDAVEHDQAARQIATDVRLSLLRLYDDRGESEKACALIAQLRAQAEATDDAALGEQLDKWYGYCDVLGRRFEATLPLGDGGTWSTTQAAGRPVLLHIWASWWPASHASFAALNEVHAGLTEQGVELVSIDLGPAPPAVKLAETQSRQRVVQQAAAPKATWPMCLQPAGAMNLRELFRIHSLPRYVLLDSDGRVKALGGSLAILSQLPATSRPESTPDTPAATGEVEDKKRFP
jgi:hypothetical protein